MNKGRTITGAAFIMTITTLRSAILSPCHRSSKY